MFRFFTLGIGMKKLAFFLLFLTFSAYAVNGSNKYFSRRFILGFKQGLNGIAVIGVSLHKTPNFLDVGRGNVVGLRLKEQSPKIAQELLQSGAGQAKIFEQRFRDMINAGTLEISYSQ